MSSAAGVSGMMFQSVFEGSLSIQDMEIERRPYHKNCSCALHNTYGGVHSNACSQRNISFPKKQSWSNSSLCIKAATSSNSTSRSTGDRESLNGIHPNPALSHIR